MLKVYYMKLCKMIGGGGGELVAVQAQVYEARSMRSMTYCTFYFQILDIIILLHVCSLSSQY
jgi:hypothetical protein